MLTILFAPAVFNLAETTRMIEVAKQMQGNHHCEFFGFSKTFASLITKSGFTYHLLTPTLTEKQEEQIIKLDQLRSIKNPFTKGMVAARILSEQKLIDKLAPQVIVTGSNVTIFLSARSKQIPLVYVKPYAMSDPFFRSDSAFLRTVKDTTLVLDKKTIGKIPMDAPSIQTRYPNRKTFYA